MATKPAPASDGHGEAGQHEGVAEAADAALDRRDHQRHERDHGRDLARQVDATVARAAASRAPIRASGRRPAIATGTLMKKIARQPSVLISTPPTSGPPDSATLAPARYRPTARARAAGSRNVWFKRLSDDGTQDRGPDSLNGARGDQHRQVGRQAARPPRRA